MATAATCICLQGACDAGVVNEARLQQLAAAAELKVRRVASSPADLLVSRSGSTLAFLLWRPGGAGGSDSGGMVARTTRMAGSFRQAYVLVPHELLGSPVILDASARCTAERPVAVARPPGQKLAPLLPLQPTLLLPACWPAPQPRLRRPQLCVHARRRRIRGASAGAGGGAAAGRGGGGAVAGAGGCCAGPCAVRGRAVGPLPINLVR